MRERAGLVGEGVGVGIGADPRRLRGALSPDDDRSGQEVVAPPLVHGVGFPGEHGLVDLQPALAADHGIRRDLVTRPQHQEVVEHDLALCDLRVGTVPTHPGEGRMEQREPVEGDLGADLLVAADQRVEDRREAEERILPMAEQQKDGEARDHDAVEQREDVRADDVPPGAAGGRLEGVRLPRGRPLRDLGRTESVEGHGIHASHDSAQPFVDPASRPRTK